MGHEHGLHGTRGVNVSHDILSLIGVCGLDVVVGSEVHDGRARASLVIIAAPTAAGILVGDRLPHQHRLRVLLR